MPCKEPVRNAWEHAHIVPSLYRELSHGKPEKLGDLSILRTNRKDVLEPYWQDETDWLSTVEILAY
jgi:hypothetical protein